MSKLVLALIGRATDGELMAALLHHQQRAVSSGKEPAASIEVPVSHAHTHLYCIRHVLACEQMLPSLIRTFCILIREVPSKLGQQASQPASSLVTSYWAVGEQVQMQRDKGTNKTIIDIRCSGCTDPER